jgi:phenylalanyl-tRNA synthetase beta chain
LFEAGNVYQASGTTAEQLKRICLGATGSAEPAGVQLHQETRHEEVRPLSFFDVKGDIENLLHPFQHNTLHFDSQTADYYHPGRSARAVIDGVPVAQFGQIHPSIAAARKLRQDVFIAELNLDQLYRYNLRQVRYEPLPRYPAVERDFSFVFADSIGSGEISKAVTTLGVNQLRSFSPVEIFRSGGIPAGKYSLLLRARFQSGERTLREDEVAQWSQQIVRALEALGGTLRSQ